MWKTIPGFDGLYEASDDGRIRSATRKITSCTGQEYIHFGKELKPNVVKNGYSIVHLMKDGSRQARYIHRLVAETFIPNETNLPTVNHIDGNKKNCNVQNLEWSSYSGNNQHAYDTGLKPRGEGFYCAKLCEDDVREIRQNGKHESYKTIGDHYNVSAATIRDVLLNRTWRNI